MMVASELSDRAMSVSEAVVRSLQLHGYTIGDVVFHLSAVAARHAVNARQRRQLSKAL